MPSSSRTLKQNLAVVIAIGILLFCASWALANPRPLHDDPPVTEPLQPPVAEPDMPYLGATYRMCPEGPLIILGYGHDNSLERAFVVYDQQVVGVLTYLPGQGGTFLGGSILEYGELVYYGADAFYAKVGKLCDLIPKAEVPEDDY